MARISRPPFMNTIADSTMCVTRSWLAWFQEVQASSESGQVELAKIQVSTDSSIDIQQEITNKYNEYRLVFEDVSVVTDGALINIRVSEDNGATWKSGAFDYGWVNTSNDGTAITSTGDNTDTELTLMEDGIESTPIRGGVCGHVYFYGPSATTHWKTFMWDLTYQNTAGPQCRVQGSGKYRHGNAINGIRIMASSGNLASGTIKLYGIK